MMTNPDLYSDLAIPPGEYLAEVLEELGMTQVDLARRTGRPPQAINEIVRGRKIITPDTALQLEQVTGVPAGLWTGLEDEYRLTLARQQDAEALEAEATEIDLDIYRVMASYGWVPKVRDRVAKTVALRRFFAVASLRFLPDAAVSGAAFRVSNATTVSAPALAAWLRKAELEAREVSTAPYASANLREVLPQLRAFTADVPEVAIPGVERLLASCGVALVILPHLPKTFACGATFWLSPDKAVIVLSNRGSWADIFWFSLFHELGHVLLHGKRVPIVSLESGRDKRNDPHLQNQEDEADSFASDALIPPAALRSFLERGVLSRQAVHAFAEEVGVAAGCIVGRLQHEKLLGHDQLNDLRDRYELLA